MKIIKIPEEYQKYIELLISHGYADNEMSVTQKLVEDGLMQILHAISLGPRALGRENMDPLLDYLKNCESIQMPLTDDFIGYPKIPSLSKYLNISINLTLTLLFFTGLYTEGYYFLRHEVSGYQSDKNYKEMVDEIPHDPDFESKQNVPEGRKIIKDDENLDIHNIH
jgi:hypothetical protein